MILTWLALMLSLWQASEAAMPEVTVGGFSIRLVNGSDGEGRVEVRRNATEEWGTVCNDYWDDVDAAVVCRMFNFKYGTAHSTSISTFPRGVGPINMDNVDCRGNETSLVNCAFAGWGIHNCGHYEDAGVKCLNQDVQIAWAGSDMGVVQIRELTGWRQVCDSQWDDLDAKVVCKQLGYDDGKAMCCSKLSTSSGYYYGYPRSSYTNFMCTGTEQFLRNCSYSTIDRNCNIYNTASVICYKPAASQADMAFSVRLHNGSSGVESPQWGMVQVRHLGKWGISCADNWNDTIANIACKQMNHQGGIAYGTTSRYQPLPSWVSSYNCTGSESSLENCVEEPWGQRTGNCIPNGAMCYSSGPPILRLVGGTSRYGRVEITINGETGTICDNSWTNIDASVICTSLGFVDGFALKGSYYGSGNGSILMDGMLCNGREDSVFSCQNKGWGISDASCADHSKDASVVCHGEVRLRNGDHSSGIVQIKNRRYGYTTWTALCGTGFDDTEARVVCLEMGFSNGRPLPVGSYGNYYGTPYIRNNIACTGSESSILNCSYAGSTCSSYSYTNYASVACFNGSLDNTTSVTLEGGVPAYQSKTGRVVVTKHGVKGRICQQYWGDSEASVVCRQLSLSNQGGVAFKYDQSGRGPFWFSEVSCFGNETILSQCTTGPEGCSSSYRADAGVLCYTSNRAPSLSLVGGTASSGSVQITYDNERGYICADKYFYSNTVKVICKQMGFIEGVIPSSRTNLPTGGAAFMDSPYCQGYESSVFQCRNAGWRSKATCNKQANVICYKHVKLVGGRRTDSTYTGRVQLYFRDRWRSVCSSMFDDNEARVTCRELGFLYGKALSPGAFGRLTIRNGVGGFNCTGSETSLANCSFTFTSYCYGRYSYSSYASVACSNTNMSNRFSVSIGNSFPAEVTISMYGINGTVCSDGWGDEEANVLCKRSGYISGIAPGPSTSYYSSTVPRLLSGFNCTGRENSLESCPHSTVIPSSCSSERYVVRIVCFNTDNAIQMKLTGGISNSQGIVNIKINGQWGTICDSYFSTNDAQVVCRQLGYLDGTSKSTSLYGNGTGLVHLSNPSCTGSEGKIWYCPNAGFNVTTSFCLNHNRDARVSCTGYVRLQPNARFGAVQLYDQSTRGYGMICAENFTNVDATVTCNELGYEYGISICCSAFGTRYAYYNILRSKISCTGREPSLMNCSYESSLTYCPTRKYASVACSSTLPGEGYELQIGSTTQVSKGRVQVTYMGIKGYICPDGFDDSEATVICKMKGFNNGFAYVYRNYYGYSVNNMRWLSNIQCTGTESSLNRCGGMVWGDIKNCSSVGDAAVYCYQNTGLQVRLNGTRRGSGRVEVAIEGVWGKLCYYSSSSSSRNKIADVVCREKGFEGGIFTLRTRNQGTGPVYITNLYCKGTENSLKECAITWGTAFRCYHVNVRCHGPVRVLGAGSRLDYGRVEMKQDNLWIPVCDDQFTDEAARVACKELDYADGKMQCCNAIGQLSYSSTKPNITITNCTGTESSLTECQYTTGVCASGHYVTVYCSATPIKVGSIVVKIDYPISKGVVNASKYGFYGPVCNFGWTDAEANVTCKQTGKLGGVAVYTTTRSSQPMVLGGYNCSGNEASLDNCSSKGFGEDKGCSSASSYRRPAAGVLCYNNGGIGIQLVNGTSRAGRVRILYETTWGRVCQTYLSSSTANVACRQLGFNGGSIDRSYSTRIPYGQLGKVWMNGVGCSGTESSLFQCNSYSWNPSTYSYSYSYSRCYDLGVNCYNDVRLTGGDGISAGSLQVYWNNNWGHVCDHNWSPTNTRVACKELGFDDGVMACCGAFSDSGSAIMENVKCTGSESRLRDCPHGNPHSRNCYANNVGLVCYKGTKPTTYTWSLGGGNNYTGEVIVNYLGTNGSICSDDWDDNDARVACRELGYRHGTSYNHFRYNFYYSFNGVYWISKVACTGSERSLAACPTTIALGEVKTCVNRHVAGILCTDISGIYYRIAGGAQDNIGRVEVSVNGVWGSICRSYFYDREASIFCRTLGYNDGRAQRKQYPNPAGPVYSSSFQCTGDESQLADCPHTGWKKASINTNYYCRNHRIDAGIVCYEDVRLASSFAPSEKEGPIQFYANDTWNLVCDTGFTDLSAKRVCQDIGFIDGRAVCCSAYGSNYFWDNGGLILSNMSMVCSGAESSSMDCLQPTVCESQSYASAICFNSTDIIDESYQYQLDLRKDTRGMIDVYHYGTKGRICSTFWDDTNAKVFCKERGFRDGIAYQSPYSTYASLDDRGPYWTSAMNCTGAESSLLNCSFNDRLNLGNCSTADAAAAACFNDTTGIQYRLANGTSNLNGRVEISVGGVWGTVCDYYWDNREAGVMCRQLGFSDGYAISNAHYGQGTGPIWLSKLRCKGTETELHKCPHAGFSSEVIDSNSYRYATCKHHADDASVYCVDKVRLNLGMNSNMGAVEVYYGNRWVTVCDDGFDQIAAQIVCRSLNVTHGVKIAGSSFGRSSPIGVVNVTCSPTQGNFSHCKQTYTGTCTSGRYASVICSQTPIVDNGFKLELQKDTTGNVSGYLKVQLNGVWGGVCSAGFDNKAATVACKQLGFKGGVPYNPRLYERHTRPILMTDIKCTGSEKSFDSCIHSTTSNNWCDYYSPRAGVLCYYTVNGIQYRLAGDNDTSRGRLEMSYDGQWGALCGYTNDPNISKVICKETGHVDGIMVSGAKYRISSHYWFTGLYCRGNETAITMCRNNGFNNSHRWVYSCLYYGSVAVQCYNSPIKLTKVRLAGGENNSGRVEVYLEGPNQWGTVCGNSWSNDDASVVCRQLGFATGTAVLRAQIFGHGTGPIWLDDVGCIGTEMDIKDCTNSGFSPRDCHHNQDAGVVCNGTYVPQTSTITIPSSKTATTKGSQSTNTYVPSTSTVTEITLTKAGMSKSKLNGSSTPGKTASIVVPIILVLVVAGAVVGICYYKRRNRDSGLTEELVPESESGGVRLGKNIAFFSKFRSNQPSNDDIDISNSTYDEVNA
ncbi:deleted in malignant brain tumors 1 protein [Patella vulgata]|uniref:deleted in malignant brain tumors 1 protein n=1 Tax=Patella vulgata TaxID=6465 RepID=UPI0024A97628|nr:deleted in malignant brain tumors 1 protein [Patella vulgata]